MVLNTTIHKNCKMLTNNMEQRYRKVLDVGSNNKQQKQGETINMWLQFFCILYKSKNLKLNRHISI